ncbi:hypothetical protein [Kerstersia similis]|uniref:hypothetical protein n=1 Tax=Kerstersia similis TaxID=206505 RepID=UPI0039F08B71
MKNFIMLAGCFLVVGCATGPTPNYFNGNYYMAGDESCVRLRPLSNARVMCIDKAGRETGYRDAMTYEQMQMYRMHMLNQQAQMDQLSRQLQQTGQSFQNAGQQILQQSQSWSVPQVQPIPSYGGGVTTYRRVGNTIIDSNGQSCQVVGQNIICR